MVRQTCFPVLALPVASCVALDESLNFSEPLRVYNI